jgi:hypothetical protein
VLDLRDNDLTGSIPDNLSYLDNLQIVLLNYNQLDGEVPDFSFCKFLRTYFVSFILSCSACSVMLLTHHL